MTTTTKAKKKIAAECPKCGGSGHIQRYAGIANGVCFTCQGNGTIMVSADKPAIRPLTDYQAQLIETIKTASPEGRTYRDLNNLRDTAHWHYPQCPNLLEIWRERGWEQAFQDKQAEKLAEFHATRGW